MSDSHQIPGSGPDLAKVPYDLLLKMFNSVTDGILAFDREFKVLAINDSALQTLETTRNKVLGKRCHEVLRTSLCGDDCPMAQAMASGNPVVNLGTHIKDSLGRRVHVTMSCALLRDEQGTVVGGVETFVNLAKAKRFLYDHASGQAMQGIITGDPGMKLLFETLPTISQSETSVLILGETGTGKNLLARAIHNLSKRADGPLVTVNCAALPETLLESELFGYRAGAFTGANRDKPGRFAAAQGGTLFLDEVGDIPMEMQVKLLRVLQERVYERLGDNKSMPCDIRLITATNRDLLDLVNKGLFRRDLYFRINVLGLEVPPLRSRKGDIPLLAQKFVEKFSIAGGKHIAGIASGALELLMAHDYPGNVRELENIIEHAWVMCASPIIDVGDLPKRLRLRVGSLPAGSKAGFAQVEAAYLVQVLEKHLWHRGKAAAELGVHRTTLQRKIKRFGIVPQGLDGRAKKSPPTP